MKDLSTNAPVAGDLPTLFVLGDSISMHYGPFLETQLRGFYRYQRKTAPSGEGADLDEGRGANGGDSLMVLSYLKERFAEPTFRPETLLLNCGLHDIKTNPATGAKQISEAAYLANLKGIVELLANRSTRPVWVRTTHCADEIHNSVRTTFNRYLADVDAFNCIADDVMATAGISVIDLYHFTRNLGEDRNLFQDHVHFRPAICAQQAAFIAGALVARL
ncbi:lysophospholipase L1-like esterase [Neorhizobium galegae]|uniref:SGNH/GDSL hydrolase family protein n=1 Tax=Neorhizobium galegae TaxID=399 RepID=UPI001AE480BC|nr:SGNH/GDSL hydrolase family protein [Neorhizobium galegae]MBP2563166.1 lysophospholipase L1-like esterase [Neorhizobium galegae]